MQFSTECIVLQTFDYSESDCILSVFSQAHGRFSVFVRGANRSKKRFAQALDLFCKFSGEFRKNKGKQQLFRLQSFYYVNVGMGIRTSLEKIVAGSLLLEAVRGLTAEFDGQPEVYNILDGALNKIAGAKKLTHVPMIAVIHLCQLLQTLGFMGDLTSCARCQQTLDSFASSQRFSLEPREGGWLCSACHSKQPRETLYFEAGILVALNKVLSGRLAMDRLRLNPRTTDKLCRTLIDYVEFIRGADFKSRTTINLLSA